MTHTTLFVVSFCVAKEWAKSSARSSNKLLSFLNAPDALLHLIIPQQCFVQVSVCLWLSAVGVDVYEVSSWDFSRELYVNWRWQETRMKSQTTDHDRVRGHINSLVHARRGSYIHSLVWLYGRVEILFDVVTVYGSSCLYGDGVHTNKHLRNNWLSFVLFAVCSTCGTIFMYVQNIRI